MIKIPILRWGEPYHSLETDKIHHFATGEPIAEISRANSALVARDMRHAARARKKLLEIPIKELMGMCKKAGDLFLDGTLPLGDGTQTPDDFVKQQSATTGLPEHMCRFNMKKNHFVLSNIDKIFDSLTRGLDPEILSKGFGVESRGVPISYQCQSPILSLVLPGNSPGVHTLWLPIIPMQIGLMMKPGQTEPWTPYRMQAAFVAAGVPKEAIGIYPGAGAEVGAAILQNSPKSLIFGGQNTVDQYAGNPKVQVHGPGFSKIVLGDDVVDNWPKYIDMMVNSVFVNSGRGCINTSGIWASRHTKEIAEAIAERIGGTPVLPPSDPNAGLAAFTVAGQAEATWKSIEADLSSPGSTHVTERFGPRLIKQERCDYLLPTVVHCASPDEAISKKEFMFPFVTVVQCPEEDILKRMGYTLVCSLVSEKAALQRAFIDATNIDRINIGPIPTIQLNWLQPHEGNIVDFLFKARAFQSEGPVLG